MRPPAPSHLPELTSLVMVGAVTPTSARVWARAPRAGAHALELAPVDGGPVWRADVAVVDDGTDLTAAWTYPDEVPGAAPLAPDTAYVARVLGPAGLVGEARFRTAPAPGAAPRRITFAALSCHQPFAEDGAVRPGAARMLAAAADAIVERDVAFVLATGDQVYADAPASCSLLSPAYVRARLPHRADLFACTPAEQRALYHQRYRQAWALPDLQRLYASAPSYPMLDDHEIVDNAGSVPAHALAPWAGVRAAALDACFAYQAQRVLRGPRPPSLDHGFAWGGVAVYLLDVRSERTAAPEVTRVFSPAQLARFRRFLAAHAAARVLVVVVSVPLVFIPGWAADLAEHLPGHGSDGPDRWTHARSDHERGVLLGLLRAHAAAHPHQRLVLVSGDIHVGSAHALTWPEGGAFHQLTASALTTELGPAQRALYTTIPRTVRALPVDDEAAAAVTLLDAAPGAPAANPYGGLNLGLVHVEDDGARARLQLELVGVAAAGPARPVTVYRSPWLGEGG